MYSAKQIVNRRGGFTLVELIVVIGIILVIAALAAAFAPSVADSQNLTRSVDQLEQWLLTAKMRAKRDGLATGIRFIPDPNNPGLYAEFQYIQQPDPLSGGSIIFVPTGSQPPAGATPFPTVTPLPNGSLFLTGGILTNATGGTVSFGNVDFSLGGTPMLSQWLVQPGDYLEVRDSGVYLIATPVPTPGTMQLRLGSTIQTPYFSIPSPGNPPVFLSPYENSLAPALPTPSPITSPTTNYRILRQPRILIGEPPLQLPTNMVVDTSIIPQTIIPGNTTATWSNVAAGPSTYLEILFSPSGAIVGTNAGNGKILMTIRDSTDLTQDINRMGIVAVQARTGFIGAYGMAPGAGTLNYDPFYFAESGRESGL
jgi:prepilin-type N-terminal cleavage/methylation domain-containing protein